MAESDVQLPYSTLPLVRTLAVTTLVNGVPTVVQMQVVALADEAGTPIRLDGNEAVVEELQAIRQLLELALK